MQQLDIDPERLELLQKFSDRIYLQFHRTRKETVKAENCSGRVRRLQSDCKTLEFDEILINNRLKDCFLEQIR